MRPLAALAILTAALFVVPVAVATVHPSGIPNPQDGDDGIPEMGPDVPTATPPVATLVVFNEENWTFTAGLRTHAFDVPALAWNRVVMEYHQRPIGDPWDRSFSVRIGDAEVLRGTTPRTDFTITKDVTRYAALMPAGTTATMGVNADAWDTPAFSQLVTVTLRFYDEPTSALVEAPAKSVVPVFAQQGYCQGTTRTTSVDFGSGAPTKATFELFASNHGDEEAQFYNRDFKVLIDGQKVATIVVMPYIYAIRGFYGGDDTIHPVMWWTAQRAADIAGVHTGPGEIPPYRVTLPADVAAGLTGVHDVEIRGEGIFGCVWIVSGTFLLK